MKYFLLLLVSLPCFAQPNFDASTLAYRKTLSDLVKADTTNPPGNEVRAVTILAERLKLEKIPYEIVNFGENRQNIIARLKGDGSKKSLLLLAHIDVVGTKDQNWSTPPHELTEKDGFLYGRGVADDLGMALTNLEAFLELKRQNIHLKRDVILAFTGDEESGGLGIRTVLEKRPDLLDAEICLNEGGGIWMNEAGKPYIVRPQVAEKLYQDFTLTAHGETGHSSMPKKDNAIYKLARALDRIGHYSPERRLIPVTRAYFQGVAKVETGEMKTALEKIANSKGKIPQSALNVIASRPSLETQLYTTCVATMLNGGTKVNALPALATANINCRILPDESVEHVQALLTKIIADPEIKISIEEEFGKPGASAIDGVVITAIQELMKEEHPGVPVVPALLQGATDSRFLRARGVQAYGFNAMATYEKDASRAHGIDERIPASSIRPAIETMYKLVLKLAAH